MRFFAAALFILAASLHAQPIRVEHRPVELYPLISLSEIQLIPFSKCSKSPKPTAVSPIRLDKIEDHSCTAEDSLYPPYTDEGCELRQEKLFYPNPTWRRRVHETWVGENAGEVKAALKESLQILSRQLAADCVAHGGEAYWSRPRVFECSEVEDHHRCSGWLWALCEARDY